MDRTQTLATYESGVATVKALQAGKLINPDKTLREIVAIAAKIPGLGEGNPAAWELITRDFVYKGLVGPENALDGPVSAAVAPRRVLEKDIDALRESGAINFDIKLGEILELASRAPRVGGDGGNPLAWELVSRDFVLRG